MTDLLAAARESAARRYAATETMLELVDRHRDDYELLAVALHDALVLHARLDDEHGTSRGVRARAESHAISRKRFLAHQLTSALTVLADFDRRYSR